MKLMTARSETLAIWAARIGCLLSRTVATVPIVLSRVRGRAHTRECNALQWLVSRQFVTVSALRCPVREGPRVGSLTWAGTDCARDLNPRSRYCAMASFGREVRPLIRQQQETAMHPSPEEVRAAHALGEAILNLLLAHEQGSAQRSVRAAATTQKTNETARPTSELQFGDKQLLNTRQASEFLQISPRKLWAITAPRGPLPCVVIGRRTLYSLEDLHQAIEDLKQRPHTHPRRNRT